MKRFSVILLLSLVLGTSASAADATCGDAEDSLREQNAILNGLLNRRSSQVERPPARLRLGDLPVTPAARPSANLRTEEEVLDWQSSTRSSSSRSTQPVSPSRRDAMRLAEENQLPVSSVSRSRAENTVSAAKRRTPVGDWRITTKRPKSKNDPKMEAAIRAAGIEVPGKISIQDAKPIRLSVQERFRTRRDANLRIRRVGYDLEELQRTMEGPSTRALPIQKAPAKVRADFIEPGVEEDSIDAVDVSKWGRTASKPRYTRHSIDAEETIKVAAQQRSELQNASSTDEVESVLDQLRRELRREMEEAKREEDAARERRRQKAAESVMPDSTPQSIDNAASSALDLALDLSEQDEADDAPDPNVEPDVTGFDEDTPPVPESLDNIPDNPSNWDDTPWAFQGELEPTEKRNPREPFHCRQMWECAGGRHMTITDRFRRDLRRNHELLYGEDPCAVPFPLLSGLIVEPLIGFGFFGAPLGEAADSVCISCGGTSGHCKTGWFGGRSLFKRGSFDLGSIVGGDRPCHSTSDGCTSCDEPGCTNTNSCRCGG